MALPHSARTVLEHSMGQLVGTPFLAYVCASDEQTIARFLETGIGLEHGRSAVLGEVLEMAHAIVKRELDLRTPATTPQFSSADALAQLCSYSETDGMGLTTAWRRSASGNVATFEGGDEVENALLALGQDFYPALLLPHFEQPSLGRGFRSLSSGRVITEHPANDRFIAGLSGVEPLRQIFPEGAIERLTASRGLMGRSGRGGGVQAVFLSSLLLFGAEASAFAERDLTLAGYLDAVREQLRIARLLASGEEEDVTATIGLQGLDAPEGFELESPWGRLRAPSPWEKRWAPLGADLVIETTFPMAVQIRDRGPEGEHVLPEPGFFGPQRTLEQAVDQFRLSCVLASDPTNQIGVSVSWRYIPDPFQWPGFSWGLQPAAPRASRPIAELEPTELKKWMTLVKERHDGKLDLPTRRLLGAVSDRVLAEDALLDAMIALESLFGTGQGEISFRLSTALAWLLGSKFEERIDLQRRTGKLYEGRSKLVHGAHLAPARAEEDRRMAIMLAIESLRALLAERPELISDNERGRKLVLGGPGDAGEEAESSSGA